MPNAPVTINSPSTSTVPVDTPRVLQGLSISDADASGTYSIGLMPSHGALTLGSDTGITMLPEPIIGFYDFDNPPENIFSAPPPGSLFFTGSFEDVNAALATLTFTPESGYDGPAEIQMTVQDSGTGGDPNTSDYEAFALDVGGVDNVAPVIDNLDGDTADFVEEGPVVYLDVDADALVSDDGSSFEGGVLSVAITANKNFSQDIIAFDMSEDSGVLYSENDDGTAFLVIVDNVVIGEMPFEYGATGDDITVTFNADATAGAIEKLIHSLNYTNVSSTTLTTATRTVTISLSDGAGPDAQTTTVETLVTVEDTPEVNHAPTIDLDPATGGTGSVAAYTENAAATRVAPNATLSDPDINFTYNGGSINVAVTDALATDQLTVVSAGALVVLNGSAIQVNGSIIATFTGGTNGAPLVINFLPDENLSSFTRSYDVDDILRSIAYSSTSDAPEAQRALTITVNDGGGTEFDGTDTTVVTSTVNITPVNDPVLARNDRLSTDDTVVRTGDLFADNGGGTDGDPDSASPPFSITAVNGQAGNVGTQITLASGALLTVNANGTFSYDPNGRFEYLPAASSGAFNTTTTDSFTYAIGGSTATVTIDLVGVDNNDVARGNAGNNVIDGGIGINTMSYANATAGVFANIGTSNPNNTVGAGTDTLTNFQNLTGSNYVDELRGSMEANILDGGTGADVMLGWYGDDTYIVDNVGDSVRESAGQGNDTVRASVTYVLPDRDVENLTLTGSSNINGSGNALANLLTGNGGANSLAGYGGNDRIDGGGGADVMAGGLGNDTYVVDNAGDRIKESAGQGDDTVETSIDYTLPGLEIERVVVTGHNAVNVTGNAVNNFITGNDAANAINGAGGNDVIDGGEGADLMAGGIGDDHYVVDNAGDRIKENADQGTDSVESSISFSLQGIEVENLELTGANAIDGTGNDHANMIDGNGAANLLLGYGGLDQLNGGGGDDALHGMEGNDRLQGGGGADGFYFDATLGTDNVDTIVDFQVGIDTIWLRQAKFDGMVAGTLSADAFALGMAAQDATDRIIYDPITGALYFDADGTGATAAVQFATLGVGLVLSHSDFTVF